MLNCDRNFCWPQQSSILLHLPSGCLGTSTRPTSTRIQAWFNFDASNSLVRWPRVYFHRVTNNDRDDGDKTKGAQQIYDDVIHCSVPLIGKRSIVDRRRKRRFCDPASVYARTWLGIGHVTHVNLMLATGRFQRWHFVTIQSNKSVYMWIRAWLILILVSLYFSSDEETDRFALNRDKNDEGVWECEARTIASTDCALIKQCYISSTLLIKRCDASAIIEIHLWRRSSRTRHPMWRPVCFPTADHLSAVLSSRFVGFLPFYRALIDVHISSDWWGSLISSNTQVSVETGESLIFWGFKLLLPTVSLSSETLRMT